MRVGIGKSVENILGMFAVGMFGFERIALYNQEGIMVKGGYLRRLPRQEIVVRYVPAIGRRLRVRLRASASSGQKRQ